MHDRDCNEIKEWIEFAKGWGGRLEGASLVAEAHLEILGEDQSVEPLKDSHCN